MKFISVEKLLLLPLVLLLWNCDGKPEEQPMDLEIETEEAIIPEEPAQKTYTTAVQDQWLNYYKSKDSAFDPSKFEAEDKFKIIRSKSDIIPVWDAKFDPVYKPYLAYNLDSTQYVDIHSYKWKFDKNNQLQIGADQEIVLVNIPNKTVERMLFYGPSYWVEDAYFKNDSTVVLLENSTDKIPGYQEINLNKNSSQYYIYPKALGFDSDFLKNKIPANHQIQP